MADGGLSSTSPATRQSPGHKSWRSTAQDEAPRHKWQQHGRPLGAGLIAGRRTHNVRLACLFAAVAALVALLVAYLLYAPAQTPMIAIAATAYDWPLPPNAWAAEDVQSLADLDHKTIQLFDLSSEWRSGERGLAQLDRQLERLANSAGRHRTVVIWLSMPGAVDGQGHPCLIPPGAAPQDSNTWLPLATILEHLAARLPADMHKLLVLDCCRQPVNWPLGQIAGGFVTALPKALEVSKAQKLAVLSATSGDDSATASPSLQASAFGHYFRLGLAGAADDRDEGGNGNARVSLQELTSYVTRHVQAWVEHHCGRPQTPAVFPSSADFDVAWTLRRSLWREMVSRAGRIEMPNPLISAARIAPLWRKLDRLRAARPWRYDPISWRELEQRLLWLEQLASAGRAYEERASTLAAQLTTELNEAEQRLAVALNGGSLPASARILGGNDHLPALREASLPLAAYWGMANVDLLRALDGSLQRSQSDPSPANLAATREQFRTSPVAQADEANFLALCQRLFIVESWPNPNLLFQVFRARQLAERHAVPPADGDHPGDERAHAFVRGPLRPLDASRRELEDALFSGPQRAPVAAAAGEVLARLENLTIGGQAAKAFATRDALWAELPYLAQWLCRPLAEAQQQDQADLAIRQTLLPLIAAGLDLERQLGDRPREADSARPWDSDPALAGITAQQAALRQILQTAIDGALAVNEQPQTAYEIDALLTLPSLPWEVREQLKRQRLELHLKLAARYDGPFDGAPSLASFRLPAMSQAARIVRWGAHPAALLLDRDSLLDNSGEATSKNALDAQEVCQAVGQQIRQRLVTLTAAESGRLSKAPAGILSPPNKPVGPHELCLAESKTRVAAALWFSRPGVDPIRELRRDDLQAFCLWRASRALDDFYGPGNAGQEPHFALAAADFLAAARSLGPLSDAASGQARDLDSLLSRRRIAARESLAVQATDILLVNQASTVTTTIEVSQRTPEAAADLPAATVAVFLADEAGRIGPPSVRLDVPITNARPGQPLVQEQPLLETADLKARGPALQAVATIRGNDFTAPVLLRAPGGALVEFQQPVYGPPQVTVLGHDRKRASVVFILDCSHSMQEPTAVEAPDATLSTQTTRMDVAKQTLTLLLGDLAERGTLRVGVRLFGHRVGWNTAEVGKLVRQTAYSGEIPADLRPYADVEEILPLGRFDASAAGKVIDRLQSVKAWGESPLYLALRRAVGDFTAEDDAARSIVVITDGQNYQFNPPREFQTPLGEVLSSAQRAQVAIHIVGFGMPAGEAQATAREFNEIASRTGGSYAPAADATALLDSLQRLLAAGKFRVTSSSGGLVGEAELGQAVVLPPESGRRRLDVAYGHLREPIDVVGGESVELTIRRGEPRLDVVPYLTGSPIFQPLVAHENGGVTNLQAGLHRSLRLPDGVQFPISIQPTDGHFVPRPQEMWVEILPVGLPPESSPGPFIFYDAPFAAGTTVPLVNLLSRQWPAQVTKAEIRVWAKDSPSPLAEERPLSQVADRLPDDGDGFAIAGIDGIRYQVRTAGTAGQSLTVGLVERHQRADSVGSIKVALSPAPRQATHQFDPQNRIVLHTFSYDSTAIDRGQIMLQFTTREAAISHSLRTVQPTVVDVSDRSDLLELTPAASR